MSQNTKNLGEKLYNAEQEILNSFFAWRMAPAAEKQSAQTRRNVARRNLELVRSELLSEGATYSYDESVKRHG